MYSDVEQVSVRFNGLSSCYNKSKQTFGRRETMKTELITKITALLEQCDDLALLDLIYKLLLKCGKHLLDE